MSFLKKRKKTTSLRGTLGTNKVAYLDDRFTPTSRNKRKRFRKPLPTRQFNKVMKSMTVLLLLVFIGLLAVALYQKTNFFDIEEVTISGTNQFVNKEDMYALINSNIADKTYLKISAAELQNKLIENFQGAKNIEVKKIPFSKIEITVEERVPLALVSSGENTFMIDKDGFVLGLVKEDYLNLPKIDYSEEVRAATFIDTELVPVYLELIQELDTESINASSISVSKRDLTLYTNSVEVLFSRERSIRESVELLNTILKQVFTNGEKATRIDLRYEKVIVSYE